MNFGNPDLSTMDLVSPVDEVLSDSSAEIEPGARHTVFDLQEKDRQLETDRSEPTDAPDDARVDDNVYPSGFRLAIVCISLALAVSLVALVSSNISVTSGALYLALVVTTGGRQGQDANLKSN